MDGLKQRSIVVLGALAVGKSAITIQFVEERFPDMYNATIENTFQRVYRFKGEDFNTKITDTAGQSEHSLFPARLCAGVHGFIIVYSVASKASMRLCQLINEKLLNAVGFDSVPRVLVGNMTDLTEDREVSSEEGQALAESWGCPFVECSAKVNHNVDAVFKQLMHQIQLEQDPDFLNKNKKSSCTIQ